MKGCSGKRRKANREDKAKKKKRNERKKKVRKNKLRKRKEKKGDILHMNNLLLTFYYRALDKP